MMSTMSEDDVMSTMSTSKQEEITERSTLSAVASFLYAPFTSSQDCNTDPMLGTRIDDTTQIVPNTSETEDRILGVLSTAFPTSSDVDPMLGTKIDNTTAVVPDTSETEDRISYVLSMLFPTSSDVDPMLGTKIDNTTAVVPDTSET